jgi:iron only hydrogenase large subunit-like protein
MTLKKAELLELAEANDVDVDESNTVAEIKEALDEAGVDYSGNDEEEAEEEAEESETREFPPGVDDGVIGETLAKEAQQALEAQEGESEDGSA